MQRHVQGKREDSDTKPLESFIIFNYLIDHVARWLNISPSQPHNAGSKSTRTQPKPHHTPPQPHHTPQMSAKSYSSSDSLLVIYSCFGLQLAAAWKFPPRELPPSPFDLGRPNASLRVIFANCTMSSGGSRTVVQHVPTAFIAQWQSASLVN